MSASAIQIYHPQQTQSLVLIHGWGVNSGSFHTLLPKLSNFKVYLVDLPGFGDHQSHTLGYQLQTWCDWLVEEIPAGAIWLGWSMGGMVATQVALSYPQHVKGLITLASSPYFLTEAQSNWRGMRPKALALFRQQLSLDIPTTIERFLAIQAMGSEQVRDDIKLLKEQVLSKPVPTKAALDFGLDLLEQLDLRPELPKLQLPWLRLWGRLDGLVPVALIEQMPQGEHIQDLVFQHSSHAPFITEGDAVAQTLADWSTQLAS